MKKIIVYSLIAAGAFWGTPSFAQAKKAGASKGAATKSSASKGTATKTTKAGDDGFKAIKAIKYKVYPANTGGKKIAEGDIIDFNILLKCDTFVIGDSKNQPGGKATMAVRKGQNATDWMWVMDDMHAGDSAVIKVPVDSVMATIPKDNKSPLPEWMKPGNEIMVYFRILSAKSQEEAMKEQAEQAKAQVAADDKMLQDYFAKNNLKPKKTESGLYYSVTTEGSGESIAPGSNVNMNYTGKLLNGTIFDSNVDPNFKHVQPFVFPVGMGRVIKGWDEGVLLLKKGAKATFYIPSGLAYGAQGAGPNIPPNSPLIFDVEVVNIEKSK